MTRKRLLPVFPAATFEASDLVLQLLELSVDGETFVTELDGTPLQYIKLLCRLLSCAESWRNPVRRLIAAHGKKRFSRLNLPEGWAQSPRGSGYQVVSIPYVHPEAAALARADSRFRFCRRSVFERTDLACHVIRTMNIFNRSYFSAERLAEGYRRSSVIFSQGASGSWAGPLRKISATMQHFSAAGNTTGKSWIGSAMAKGEMEEMALGLFR